MAINEILFPIATVLHNDENQQHVAIEDRNGHLLVIAFENGAINYAKRRIVWSKKFRNYSEAYQAAYEAVQKVWTSDSTIEMR